MAQIDERFQQPFRQAPDSRLDDLDANRREVSQADLDRGYRR